MSEIKVDILLTYWGDFSLLKETVGSVLSQTHTNWRLLVLDDCYPSDEAAKYFATVKDHRVEYRRHKKNIGITNNFNYAIEHSRSDYCVLPGCDDRFLPDYLANALEQIGEADFFQPGVEVIDDDGRVYLPLADRVKRMLQPKKSGHYSGEKLAVTLCNGNWLYFPSILWKTHTIKRYGFNPKYKIAEDVDLELNIIKDGGILSFSKTPTFQYRRSAKSLSSTERGPDGVRFNEERDVYEHFSKEFRAKGWKKAARAAKHRITSRLHEYRARI